MDRFENYEQIHKKKQQIFTETYFILIFAILQSAVDKTLTEVNQSIQKFLLKIEPMNGLKS